MGDFVKRLQPLFVLGFVAAGALFLLRVAYLPIWLSTAVGLALLLSFRHFVRVQHGIIIPLYLLALLLAAIEVDAIGNLFGLYNQRYKYVQYDEIAHGLIPALVVPVIVWLVRQGLARFGYRLPLGLIVFFSFTTVFTLAGLYEVIELWDDKYMHPVPGWRIHGAYDTANDLQWDFLGMGLGAICSFLIMRRWNADDPSSRH
ncbi:MAG: hypothetical protein ABI882_18695 [Acidobacteriota bacterium]